jgi:hypothetical protein
MNVIRFIFNKIFFEEEKRMIKLDSFGSKLPYLNTYPKKSACLLFDA